MMTPSNPLTTPITYITEQAIHIQEAGAAPVALTMQQQKDIQKMQCYNVVFKSKTTTRAIQLTMQ